jgi:hypothetical protein
MTARSPIGARLEQSLHHCIIAGLGSDVAPCLLCNYETEQPLVGNCEALGAGYILVFPQELDYAALYSGGSGSGLKVGTRSSQCKASRRLDQSSGRSLELGEVAHWAVEKPYSDALLNWEFDGYEQIALSDSFNALKHVF